MKRLMGRGRLFWCPLRIRGRGKQQITANSAIELTTGSCNVPRLGIWEGNAQHSRIFVETAVCMLDERTASQCQKKIKTRAEQETWTHPATIRAVPGRPGTLDLYRVPWRPASMASWHPSLIRGVHI